MVATVVAGETMVKVIVSGGVAKVLIRIHSTLQMKIISHIYEHVNIRRSEVNDSLE